MTALPAGAVKLGARRRPPAPAPPAGRRPRRARSACGRGPAGHASLGSPAACVPAARPRRPPRPLACALAAAWRGRSPPRVPARPPDPASRPGFRPPPPQPGPPGPWCARLRLSTCGCEGAEAAPSDGPAAGARGPQRGDADGAQPASCRRGRESRGQAQLTPRRVQPGKRVS